MEKSAFAPRFLKPLQTRTTCKAGGSVTLEAVVIGRPPPVVSWLKNGVPVSSLGIAGDRRFQVTSSSADDDVLPPEAGSRAGAEEGVARCCCHLDVHEAGDDDEGEYECRAKNVLGQVSCFGELYVSKQGVDSTYSGARKLPWQCSSDQEDGAEEESESKSGLFILIDEGSQDDDNSDESGRRESISASEQIESIIEDLTMGDGSLSLPLSKGDKFPSEHGRRELPPTPRDKDGKPFKSKGSDSPRLDDTYDSDEFDDADYRYSPVWSKDVTSYSSQSHHHHQQQTIRGRQNLAALHLKKVAAEENLNQAFDDDIEEARIDQDRHELLEFEQTRTATVDGGHYVFPTAHRSRKSPRGISSRGSESADASLQCFEAYEKTAHRCQSPTRSKCRAALLEAELNEKELRRDSPDLMPMLAGDAILESALANMESLKNSIAEESSEDFMIDSFGNSAETKPSKFNNERLNDFLKDSYKDLSKADMDEFTRDSLKEFTRNNLQDFTADNHRDVTKQILKGTMIPVRKSRGRKPEDSCVSEPLVGLRRNTTGGADDDHGLTKFANRVTRQRSHSDVIVLPEVDDGDEVASLSQRCPWDSLEKIWRDSLPTESGEEPLPSDVDVSNEDVFVSERSKLVPEVEFKPEVLAKEGDESTPSHFESVRSCSKDNGHPENSEIDQVNEQQSI